MAEKYELAYKDYKAGMKQKDIAAKYEVTINTVKSWQQRKWKNLDADEKVPEKKVRTPKQKSMHTKKSEGAYVQDARQHIPKDIEMVIEAANEITEENAELTESQRLFCLLFVKYHNATKAYQKAYECTYDSANTSGPRLMVNACIRAEISRLKKVRAAGIMLDGNDVLQKYIDIAFADLGDYVVYGTETVPLLDDEGFQVMDPVTKEPRDYQRSYVHLKNGIDLDNSIVSEVKIGKDGISLKLHDKMEALRFLAKYTDLLDDRTKVELQNERIKVELIRAELNKQQQEKEQELKLQQMNLSIEKSKADIELAKIAIAKEKGEEDEYEDDGFMDALKGVKVDWTKS